MQRICSFTDVLFDSHGLCAPVGRKDFYGFSLSLRQSRADRRKKILFRSKRIKNPWKDKIRRIRAIRVSFLSVGERARRLLSIDGGLMFLFPCCHRYATTTSVQRNTDSGCNGSVLSRMKPPSCPLWGMIGQVLTAWVSSWLSVTKEKPLQGGVGEGYFAIAKLSRCNIIVIAS